MRFDQPFRRFQLLSYPSEDLIQETRFVNTDKAVLTLRKGGPAKKDILWIGKQSLPSHLSIQAILKPIYHQAPVEGQYVFNQNPMTQKTLYEEAQTLHSIEIVALEEASFYFKNRIETLKQLEKKKIYLKYPQGCLYRKVFKVQEENVSLVVQSQGNANFFFIPPSLQNVYPLWGYGGNYQKGCELSDIAQTFFGIETHNGETLIRLISLKTLRKEGLTPPSAGIFNNQRIVFINQEVNSFSLQEEVEGGGIETHLTVGKGEEAVMYSYISQSIRYLNPLSGHVIIHFIKREN